MTNKFLLNLLGFNPDLTSRQSRVDSVSNLSRQSDLLTHLGRIAAILLLVLTIGVGNVWGATTYKLTQVSSVSAGNKYVFVQDGHAMSNTISSSALNTTTSYSTTGLAGTESYVWELLSSTHGFYMTNPSCGTNRYLKNGSSTGVSLVASSNTPSEWTFTFTEGIALIQNYSNSSRFLGYTTASSYVYKAYATSNLSSYPHAITVYLLEEESDCSSEITITKGSNPANGTFTISNSGTVCIDEGNASTTVTATPSDHYHLATVTSTGGGSVGAISNNTCTISNISANTTINVTFAADPTYTVTWVAGSNPSFSTQTNYAGTALSDPGEPSAASYCPGGKEFVGWTATPIVGEDDDAPEDLFTSVTGKSIPVGGTTYYAVFATNAGGSDPETDTEHGKTSTPYVANDGWTASAGGTYTSTGNYSVSPSIKFNSNNHYVQSPTYSDAITNINFWHKNQGGSGYLKIYVSTDGSSFTELTGEKITLTLNQYTVGTKDIDLDYDDGYKAVKIVFDRTSGTCCIDEIAVTYGGGTSYSNYATTCCTPLGSINGSISWTNPTTAVLTWDNIDHVSSWAASCIVHGGSSAGSVGSITTNGAGKKTCTVTGLSCNTNYDFTISATAASGYCDKSQTIENENSGTWSVSYDITNGSKTSGATTACSDDITAVFAASSGYNLPDKAAITVTGASAFTWTKGTGTLVIDDADITGNISISFTCPAVSCSGFSLHTGTKSGSDWLYNKCFTDADWGAADDAIWEGEFPSTNECYVGWQGSTSDHGTYWAVGGIKTYDIPTGRTLGWNSGNYYQDYPANAYGTFHIYKNSSDENSYLRFKPSAYMLRTGTDGTSWSSTAMTKSATNDHYYETTGLTLTSTLIDEHAYVALSANNVNGYVWCNFSSDVTAENNVKVKVGYGDEDAKFRATNLADGDAGKYGKFRIDVTKDVNNWKLTFVPMYKITYAAGTGATGSMDPSAYQEIGGTIAAASEGFTDPTYKQFAGWSGSDGNDYAAGANVTMNSDVTLTAQWEDIPVTALTLNKTSIATYVGASTVTLSVSTVTPSGANPAVTWSSSDATVADVTSGGVVSFLKAGSATITATSTISGSVKATCTVNVYSVTLVLKDDADATLTPGGSYPTLTWTPTTRTISSAETGNYVFKTMTQTGGAWATSPSTTTGTTTAVLSATPTGNVTVTATYYKPRIVTWNIGEDNSHTSEVKYNTQYGDISDGKPVLDTDFDDDALAECGSTKFIGWVKSSGVRTTDGGTISQYTSNVPSASDAITANTDYYAMFAEASGSSGAAVNTVLWAEDFSGWDDGDVPSGDQTNSHTGTTVYGGATVTYTCVNGGSNTKLYGGNNTLYAGGTKPELLVGKNTGSFTVSGIPNGGASEITVSYKQNNKALTVSASGTGYSGSASNTPASATTESFDVTVGSASTFTLTFTPSTDNVRIDDISVKVKTDGTTYSNYRTGCTVTCGRPTSLTNTSITKTGATIGWTDAGAGTASKYEYAVWEDGTDEPTSGFVNNSTNTTATLSGLYSGIKYNWKVRKVCTGGDGESRWAYSYFTTTAAALTYSVPEGVTAVTTPATNAGDLNSADVPTDCGDCWAFVGWTTATYAENSSAPATLFPAGTKAKVSGDATLYAVYGKEEYNWITNLSDLEANEYYVLTSINASDVERAMTNTLGTGSFPHYTTSADITIKEYDDGWVLYNPSTSIIWKLSGTYSSGKLYNEAAGVYLDLSVKGEDVLKSSTSDNLVFSKANSERFDIASTTTSANYLYMFTNEDGVWGIDDEHAGFSSCFMYKRQSSTYATTPDCPKYTVTWDTNNGATTSTTEVTKCQGYLASLPSNPVNNTLDACIGSGKGRFMGWSPEKVMPAQNTVPTGMFNAVEDAPEITENTSFYAVFAKETTGAVAATSKTYTFTSASWGDDASAWTSGKAGAELTSNRGVKVTETYTGANATTKSSYDDVTKVVVTYSTNKSDGAGKIQIKVGDTEYGNTSVTLGTTGDGRDDRTIDFTPPSSALDGAVKIAVTCTKNSIYIKSVQIFYTGSTTTYEGYRTACCDDADLTFGTQASPVTEYVIVREDLASANTAVEIDCNFESDNTTEDITWSQTKRIKTDYHSANTWIASQTDRCQIDIANKKISAYETGSWQISIAQAMGSTDYCDETATVNVLVKTVDKFIDAVNGNFSGEAQRLEDVGNGITLPTETTFSTDNGCADGTTRRLIGWIKASDLATYASGRRVDMIDDLKTGDGTNKVIAPGTKVEATGVTWYAVWGVEK